MSWKDDENDKLIAKNGPVEPVMDQEEETAVIGNDETSAGHDDETMASNMARSEETSAVLQTFSDEEGDDSLFEISSQEMDMLFKTEVSKKENTPTEVSPVPGSKGTVLGVGPPTPSTNCQLFHLFKVFFSSQAKEKDKAECKEKQKEQNSAAENA